jgi:hypothetical protein
MQLLSFAPYEDGNIIEYHEELAHVIWKPLIDSYDIRDRVAVAEIRFRNRHILTQMIPRELADQRSSDSSCP